MRYKILVLILFLFFGGCQGLNDEYVNLSGKYWYKRKSNSFKTIESKILSYHNKIYPTVTDYAFNEKFIIAEQKPEKNLFISLMGDDLSRRFEDYSLYKKDTNILKDSFYTKLKGKVEKDSALYKLFFNYGASQDQSKNLEIGIMIAQNLIQQDEKTIKLFNNNINYWIIIHSLDTIVGPLTKDEYINIRPSLGIPDNIKLKFEK